MDHMDNAHPKVSASAVQRRTLVKGAAWSMPVAAAVAAAPSAAASPIPPRGLNGWVQLSRDCSRTDDFQINGLGTFVDGSDDERGIWTFSPQSSPPVAAPAISARIVFFLDRNDAIFTNSSQAGWSNLVRNAGLDGSTPQAGYYAYETTYTGTWTWFPAPQAWSADGDPYWLWNMPSQTCSTVCAYARRSINLTNPVETITFTRGPVCV